MATEKAIKNPRSNSAPYTDTEVLSLKGAAEHNLKGIDIDIPHDQLVVLTGLSGSGKSSFAFDTVYAEGQRRFLETFSPYIRQFFARFKKPEFDSISNIRPTLAVQQRTRIRSSRSTVGTLTHINDLLKILWTNISAPNCPSCDIALEHWQPPALAAHLKRLLSERPHAYFIIACPLVSRDLSMAEELERLRILGFERYFDCSLGQLIDAEDILSEQSSDNFARYQIVLSRVRHKDLDVRQLQDTVSQAFKMGQQQCIVIEVDRQRRQFPVFAAGSVADSVGSWSLHRFFQIPSCPQQQIALVPPRPALFTFNHPLGACDECKGFGANLEIDLEKCIPDTRKSLDDGAIVCWTTDSTEWERKQLAKFCKRHSIPMDIPWNKLSDGLQQLVLNTRSKSYWGVLPWFEWLESKKYKMHVRVFLAKYKVQVTCGSCSGKRLKPDALAYKVAGLTLPDLWAMPLEDLLNWIVGVRKNLEEDTVISKPLKEVFTSVESRLGFMVNLGLPYLTLDRTARTLSGGETQRVNLANALGSDLVSSHFVLDEPSVGLHSRDSMKLARAVRELSDRGNSVLMVEHDPDLIASADTLIELGPEAGAEGGEVVFNGRIKDWKGLPRQKFEEVSVKASSFLKVRGASANNIENIDVDIPLGAVVCLTGVSGSGKSTLLNEIVYNGWQVGEKTVKLPKRIEQVLMIDQSPLVKSPRANIGTYTKIWDVLRTQLAATDAAKERGISKSMFSFNVDGGRCSHCKGAGYIKEDMQFLSDVVVPCEVCGGDRFGTSVLEVRLKGKNVIEWLRTTVDQAASLLENISSLRSKFELLQVLGLGHLTIGHSLAALSGGEAQRLKLVPVLEKGDGESLLLFDEPTTGLHVLDVLRLVELFKHLRERGNSIICVAHHLTLIAHSDWLIDLGPEGGSAGGTIVEQGNPLDVAGRSTSYTGKALKRFIDSKGKTKPPKIASKRLKRRNKTLKIHGAREHNLKDIEVEIKHGELIALTGVSGSGKSTIARDIVHAEAQHQYLSCLSPYARQFVNTLSRPDVDSIDGLRPTICIAQHTFQPSALSTVGTVSEVYHFLRLLFSKIGKQFCVDHPSQQVGGATSEQVVEQLKSVSKSRTVRILAPVIQSKKGSHKAVVARALALELDEIRVDGVYGAPSKWLEGLDKRSVHTIEFVILKGRVSRIPDDLLSEAADEALRIGSGDVILDTGDTEERFSLSRSCPKCGKGYAKPDPEDLSFNSRRGRCTRCSGTGKTKAGSVCKTCKGQRLNAKARKILLNGESIGALAALTPQEVIDFLENLKVTGQKSGLVAPLIIDIKQKLNTLLELGLGYLSLDRDCRTLSGGELQRLRLATALGSPLAGVMYIFDEPSIGLHPDDNEKVLGKLKNLRDIGNTVIMIEHDPQSILACDSVLEVGPGGGRSGGQIVYSGTTDKFKARSKTTTAERIRRHGMLEMPSQRKPDAYLRVSNAKLNNLDGVELQIPQACLVSVVGVSGAGKSSLVRGVVETCLAEGKETKKGFSHRVGTVASDIPVDRVLRVDQKPIGANSRSTPVSYLGLWDPIRKLFAQTLQAKGLGWKAKHFSYNAGDGRCSECSGQGTMKLEMSFLPDARVVCPVCRGSRFKDEVREVKYLGLSIDEVLDLTFEEARQMFANHKKLHPVLSSACDLGLGYLTLGQPAPSLSGGESQRIKLVSELSKRPRGHTLYLLDEPTTGLHLADIAKLMKALHKLVDTGSSVVIVEHELEVIKQSDWIVELGPGAADAGGTVVFSGAPSKLAGRKTPWGQRLLL